MKFISLDGSVQKISINPLQYPFRPQEFCSKIEWATGQYLKKKFPFDIILSQWILPSTQLRADFYVPMQHLIVEADGVQHQVYTGFFHSNQQGFDRSKQRDNTKELLCKLNNIRLVRVSTEQDLENI